MASATEPQAEAPSVPTASETGKAAQPTATSPARSDKSSDSEGKPVREKLKETRIDAQGVATSENGVNGSAKSGEQSASGSDSERGRLRRKRSREDFEDEAEADKHAGKKIEVAPERHVRKRSRDISKDDLPPKPAPSRISSINENDVDEQMTSPNKAKTSSTTPAADTSPKNKRTRDQAESDAATEGDAVQEPSTNGKPVEGRDTKRPRDQEDDKDFMSVKPQSKVAPSSGFANTSAASPFAAMAAKPKQESKTSDNTLLPQTSEDKFKASGFGSFSSSASSPFGGLGSSKSAAASPFGAASGNKLSSFAGSNTSSKSPPSGFAGLGGFSGGSMAGKGFGSLGGLGSNTGLTNFGTPGNTEIKGLKVKNHQPFGAAGEDSPSGSEDDDDSDPEGNGEEKVEGKPSKTLIASPPRETGEEGESTIWQGRAKLYTMAGDDGNRAWKERGTGNFKFNITNDDPRKARFVLRADGTHRLLLNAAVTKTMTFGGNAQGEKPKDTRLLFNAPTPEGELEMYLLKLKAENAIKLWEEVTQTQEKEL